MKICVAIWYIGSVEPKDNLDFLELNQGWNKHSRIETLGSYNIKIFTSPPQKKNLQTNLVRDYLEKKI